MSKITIFRSLFILMLALASSSIRAQEPLDVSLVRLLSNPEKYDGKKVRVTGFLHVQFEDSALYLHKDDADILNGYNGLWISYADSTTLQPVCKNKFLSAGSDTKYFDGRYVLVEGVFNMKMRGHLGAFSGSIQKVSRVLEQRQWFDGKRQVTVMNGDGRIKENCK